MPADFYITLFSLLEINILKMSLSLAFSKLKTCLSFAVD